MLENCILDKEYGMYKDKNGIYYATPYCKKHYRVLRFVRIEFGVEIYYCDKCHKEYTEYSDISAIYWSNYEWMYDPNDKL